MYVFLHLFLWDSNKGSSYEILGQLWAKTNPKVISRRTAQNIIFFCCILSQKGLFPGHHNLIGQDFYDKRFLFFKILHTVLWPWLNSQGILVLPRGIIEWQSGLDWEETCKDHLPPTPLPKRPFSNLVCGVSQPGFDVRGLNSFFRTI